jgi:hypothetical protein
MKTAGLFLLMSAGLHVVGSVLLGFSAVGVFLLLPAVLYTAFWFGLRQGLTWVAWISFVCMLGGMAGTGVELLKVSSVPNWILWGIIAADFAVAAFLVKAIFAKRLV